MEHQLVVFHLAKEHYGRLIILIDLSKVPSTEEQAGLRAMPKD
jgi:hypothetical protein